jgi:hypothetical protein
MTIESESSIGPSDESMKDQEQRTLEAEERADRTIFYLPDEEALEALAQKHYAALERDYNDNIRLEYVYQGALKREELPPTKDGKPSKEEKEIVISRDRLKKGSIIELPGSDIQIHKKTGWILVPCWIKREDENGEVERVKDMEHFTVTDLHGAIRMQDNILEENYGLALKAPHPEGSEMKRFLDVIDILEEVREKYWQLGKRAEDKEHSEEQLAQLTQIVDLTNKCRGLLSEKGFTNLLKEDYKKEINDILEEFEEDLKSLVDKRGRFNPTSKAMKIMRAQNRGIYRLQSIMEKISPVVAKRKQVLINKKLEQDYYKNKLVAQLRPWLGYALGEEVPEDKDRIRANFDDQEAEAEWEEDADQVIREQGTIDEENAKQVIKEINERVLNKIVGSKLLKNRSIPGVNLVTSPYSWYMDKIFENFHNAQRELNRKNIEKGRKYIRNIPKILDILENLDKVFAKR